MFFSLSFCNFKPIIIFFLLLRTHFDPLRIAIRHKTPHFSKTDIVVQDKLQAKQWTYTNYSLPLFDGLNLFLSVHFYENEIKNAGASLMPRLVNPDLKLTIFSSHINYFYLRTYITCTYSMWHTQVRGKSSNKIILPDYYKNPRRQNLIGLIVWLVFQ